MINFAHLTDADRERLAMSVFADWRASQIPSDWRALVGSNPSPPRSDSEPAVPSGKRMARGGA